MDEKIIQEIKNRALQFALDNHLTHKLLVIESAMLIGATISIEHATQNLLNTIADD